MLMAWQSVGYESGWVNMFGNCDVVWLGRDLHVIILILNVFTLLLQILQW